MTKSVIAFRAVLLIGLAVVASAPLSAQTGAEQMAAIERAQPDPGDNPLAGMTIEELMENFGVPGVSIAVIHDFEIHWAKGYGVADVVTGARVDTETMFQAASMSKPVAAMATLRAVQDGLFTPKFPMLTSRGTSTATTATTWYCPTSMAFGCSSR